MFVTIVTIGWELVFFFFPHLIVTLESHKLKVQCISYMYCIRLAIVLVVVVRVCEASFPLTLASENLCVDSIHRHG